MPRTGFVIETMGEHALISTSHRGICDDCADRSACTVEKSIGRDKPQTVKAQNPIHARTGDHVEFDLPGHTELKVSLILWVVPLAGLIAGAAVGANLDQLLSLSADLATLLGALSGCGLAFALLMLYDRRAAKDPRLTPRILKVVQPPQVPAACPGESSDNSKPGPDDPPQRRPRFDPVT